MNRRMFWAICAIAGLRLAHTDVAAAELVVIVSAGPELFVKGDVIRSGQEIRVPDGASVTVMDDKGKVITVRGPFAGAIGGSEGDDDISLIKLVSALFTEHPTHPLGAFRGAFETKEVYPWAIDASTPGDKCIRNLDATVLWKPNYGKLDQLILTHVAEGKTVKVRWPADAATIAWPREIPREQGAPYEAKLSYQLEPNRFVLHIADSAPAETPHTIAWMVRTGCYSQAKALLSSLPVDKVVRSSGSKD